jgi:hypothetical protein
MLHMQLFKDVIVTFYKVLGLPEKSDLGKHLDLTTLNNK